jgi:hypothetical protein
VNRTIPEDPADININASQQGLLEIAEHFFRQKMRAGEEKVESEEKDGLKKDN